MRRFVMVSVAALAIGGLLLCSPALTAVVNPETFESYALTNNFQDVADTGWTFDTPPTTPNNHRIILAGSQVYKMENYIGGSGVTSWWNYSVPAATMAQQLVKYDFNLSDTQVELGGTVNDSRALWQYGRSASNMAAHVDVRFLNGVSSRAYLWTNNGPEQDLPGKANIVMDTWYTVEVELDFDLNKSRARFGPRGGTPYGWTGWLPHRAETSFVGEAAMLIASGGVMWDNLHVVIPEPSTAMLAALGLIGLLGCGARKRRAGRRS